MPSNHRAHFALRWPLTGLNCPLGSVVFSPHCIGHGSRETVSIYRITRGGSEGKPTWNNFASKYDNSKWGSFVAQGTGVVTADVTGLVSAWTSNSKLNPNYGMMLKSSPNRAYDEYLSSEVWTVSSRPWLKVCYP